MKTYEVRVRWYEDSSMSGEDCRMVCHVIETGKDKAQAAARAIERVKHVNAAYSRYGDMGFDYTAKAKRIR